jgi:hypothetical protein
MTSRSVDRRRLLLDKSSALSSDRLEIRFTAPLDDDQQSRPGAGGTIALAGAPWRALSRVPEAVGKRSGGVDIDNGDDGLAPAIALRRHPEG